MTLTDRLLVEEPFLLAFFIFFITDFFITFANQPPLRPTELVPPVFLFGAP
jgi:hypothetical protein